MTGEPIRLLLVDDHPVVRKGLLYVLSDDKSFEVVAEASSGEEALFLCQKFKPDVILMDIKMDGVCGIETTRLIVEHQGAAKVIGLSTFGSRDIIEGMKAAGASGYLLKDLSPAELVDAVRHVNQGGVQFPDPQLHQASSETEPKKTPDSKEFANLGVQQSRVLALMTKGLTNPEIAEQLGISIPTARYHVSAILRKLQVSNRSEAVAAAIHLKLVDTADIT